MLVHSKALATIESSDDDDGQYGPNGGFTAILSTPSRDRDGDELLFEEWKSLPDRLPLDADHGMSVATTVGSFHPYWENGAMMMKASFSSIPRAQEVRTLVKEKHISGVSVAFMTDRTKKSGEQRRELLNAGIVAIPSNRDAQILDSKALDLRAEELAEQAQADAEIDAVMNADAKAAGGDAPALTQAIHDAAVHLGAVCYPIAAPEDPSGASEGANKSTDDVETDESEEPETKSTELRDLIAGLDAVIDEAYRLVKGQSREGLPESVGQALDLLSAAHESVGSVMEQLNIFDPDADEGGYTRSTADALVEFSKRLSELFIGSSEESPAESPADDASDEEPSDAAEEAAESELDFNPIDAEVLQMQLRLSI